MLLDVLLQQSNVALALYASLFTWGMTALGAGIVFFFKEIKAEILNMFLGFASGVMIAASFFSLFLPAQELAEGLGLTTLLVTGIGLMFGAGILWSSA